MPCDLPVDPVAVEVFRHLFASVAEEMGVALERTAYSPNIKERRDYSCALFDASGALVAQAAHIPVHLGAFPQMMATVVPCFDWRPGDVVACNDPFAGGTHLPDLSLITAVFDPESGRRCGFVANRAHHADIGGVSPGSMASTTEIYQEGVIVPPLRLVAEGRINEDLIALFCRNVRTPRERRGDLLAQMAANETGVRRFQEILRRYGAAEVKRRVAEARAVSERAVRALLHEIPPGEYWFEDALDDDGHGSGWLPIRVTVRVHGDRILFDFTGTAPQQRGSVNATLAVTHSAVYYVVISLLSQGPEGVPPLNQGCVAPIQVEAPPGSLVHALPPAAVAAGNVETSQRIVDTVYGALAQALPERVPAASQGTMNNLALGGSPLLGTAGRPWAYYETVGGGAGASATADGASGIHCHMSNTRNTPAEALEYHYPLRLWRYAIRDGSGGTGRRRGGDGLIRELEVLEEATVTFLSERRARGPYGLQGGAPGAPGRQGVKRSRRWRPGRAKETLALAAGDRLRVETPGGGGWGAP
ncbi:MAG: hydantoinase B/oxoprolinase family protein [Armatimonadetes bacterium]|nr:hydantoinase B/oxoprolinase family protein [Armatimonadota bacterium]